MHERKRTARLSLPLKRLALTLSILILLTSSFDTFLVLTVGGNYRFCQIATPVLVLLALIQAARARAIPVLGAVPLCIWFVFQVLFIPTTGFWPKSLGYCLWLLLNYSLIFAFVQLFSDETESLRAILRWYAYSFGLLAVFGIVQFFLPLLGGPGILVQQWWIPGVLARVSGFSYEPSYFATYLLIGFVFIGTLRRRSSTLLPAKVLLAIYLLTAAAIFLSSSRMGIIFLFLDVVLAHLPPWRPFLKTLANSCVSLPKLRALIPSFVCVGL
ncbi:MAG: hypothetical protein JO319_14170, partial [Acidobacteriaceae bacterium]|nr:hypothetical protein [Acidobacteriaceae bacterium]